MDFDIGTDYIGSDDDGHYSSQATRNGRKNIRAVKKVEDLSTDSRVAILEEDARIKRVENLKKKLQDALITYEIDDQLILDYDFENKTPNVSVHKNLVNKLKFHQKEGVKFMWYACYESLEQTKKSKGSGCILAHCMGLGKTLQVITLVHTLLNNKQVGTNTVLICCPKNTLMNWLNEFKFWISSDLGSIQLFNPTIHNCYEDKLLDLSMWHATGGVCILNYELFRILLDQENKNSKEISVKLRSQFKSKLLDPGPDLVICDEGHVLKNEDTKLARIMGKIRTLRRIILTGTPLQNNLKEYHCMVQFVKPHLLGTRNEFLNMFLNPILNGQYENSLVEDVRLMKERSHILHKKLLGCIQRFDLIVLQKFLPEKQEYVISISLTDCQIDLYRHYLENYSAKGNINVKKQATDFFADYQALQRIWTHPYTFKLYEDDHIRRLYNNEKNKKKRKKKKSAVEYSLNDYDDSNDSDFYEQSKCPLSWWSRFVSIDDVEDVRQGNKLVILLKILKECEDLGEKMLIFSNSLYSLTMIQHFLQRINHSGYENSRLCNMMTTWEEGKDFLVLTGQTSAKERDEYCRKFNDINDVRMRLFLISTKAGGMGINLVAASRAVLFDVSWNPSNDIQSIFRIYRLGQRKPCFVYRLVAAGTMEEKIYERQITKQSMSYRVVDEKHTARHFTQRELASLYKFEPYKKHRINIVEPRDTLLQTVFNENYHAINGIHEHDSLLAHKKEEELEEAEKSNAWTAYNIENDSKGTCANLNLLTNKIKPDTFDPMYLKITLERQYPELSEVDLKEVIEKIMPSIRKILKQPDFIERMTKQALLIQELPPTVNTGAFSAGKAKKIGKSNTSKTSVIFSEKENEINMVNSPSETLSVESTMFDQSDSDDSIFLYDYGKKPKKRKSLKKISLNSWGKRNGKEFGTPDLD